MPIISVSPLPMRDGTVISQYKNTVHTSPETFTFQKPQEWVVLYNKGTADLIYTIGTQSGTLKPAQHVKVEEILSSFILSSVRGTQAFEIRSDEEGSTLPGAGGNVPLDVTEKLNELDAQLAQTQNLENFEITNKKRKARPLAVFTIDDGNTQDYTDILPLFNSKGIKATTAIVSDVVGNQYIMTYDQLRELQDVHGWEIASHSKSHVSLPGLTDVELTTELEVSRDTLRANGLDVRNVFVPYGDIDNRVMEFARRYYRSARTSGMGNSGTLNYSPVNTFRVNSADFGGSDGSGQDTVDYFKGLADTAKAENGLLVVIMHSKDVVNNGRLTDLGLIIDYIQSIGIEIVTYNEALNEYGNIVDTFDFKVGAEGKLGGKYGRIKFDDVNSIINDTLMSDLDSQYFMVNTVSTSNTVGFPSSNGGTLLTVKADMDDKRNFQFFKPYGKELGFYFRDTDGTAGTWQKFDNIYVHPSNSLLSSHLVSDLKSNRLNYCWVSTANATGYPENTAGVLVADYNISNTYTVREEYRIYNSNRTYRRYWNGTAWSEWKSSDFETNFSSKMNQPYTIPTIVQSRVTDLSGGFIQMGNMVFVNVKFTASVTFSPTIVLSGLPNKVAALVSTSAISCINLTDNSVGYANIGVSNGYLNASVVADKTYAITGWYSIA